MSFEFDNDQVFTTKKQAIEIPHSRLREYSFSHSKMSELHLHASLIKEKTTGIHNYLDFAVSNGLKALFKITRRHIEQFSHSAPASQSANFGLGIHDVYALKDSLVRLQNSLTMLASVLCPRLKEELEGSARVIDSILTPTVPWLLTEFNDHQQQFRDATLLADLVWSASFAQNSQHFTVPMGPCGDKNKVILKRRPGSSKSPESFSWTLKKINHAYSIAELMQELAVENNGLTDPFEEILKIQYQKDTDNVVTYSLTGR